MSLSKQWQRNINTLEIHGTSKKDILAYSRNKNTPEIHQTSKKNILAYSKNINTPEIHGTLGVDILAYSRRMNIPERYSTILEINLSKIKKIHLKGCCRIRDTPEIHVPLETMRETSIF